jgi:hypothetical protein
MKSIYWTALIVATTLWFSATAMAAQQSILCRKSSGKAVVSIEIDFSASNSGESLAGQYQYDSQWHGSFPTENSDDGVTTGALANTTQGIVARFDFVAFNVPAHLEVHQSVGQVVIGAGSNPEVDSDLNCSLQ